MLWFTQGVYRWRTGAAVAWTCLLSCPALVLYQLLSQFNPLHPLIWLQDWLSSVLSLRSFIFSILYLFLLIFTCNLYSLTFTVILPVYKTRLSVLGAILRPSRLAVIASYAVLGSGAAYCLAELAGYHHLWTHHQSYKYCLNEWLFFHALHGSFLGLRYGVKYYIQKENFMVFPSIQQHKLFRLRGHVTSHVTDGLLRTLEGLKYFYPLYFLLGYYPRSRFIKMFGLQLRDDVRLTSLSSLMDLGLFMSLLVAGTTIHMGWSFGLRIFRTFQTQVVQFPVVARFSGEKSRLLTVAIACRSYPLVRSLGFLDLHQLALYSHSRRSEVFGLNEEGKPEVWEAVSKECVSLVQTLTARLGKKEGVVSSTAGPASTSPTQSVSPHSSFNGGSPEKGWPEMLPATTTAGVLAPPSVSRRMVNTEKTRLWSYSPPGVPEPQTTPPAPTKPHPPHNSLDEVKKARENLRTFLTRTRDSLRRKPFFEYFLSELPEATTQEKFFDSKLQVWAITGIAQLAVASYKEDQYGVVQRTLPQILSALIGLSKEMDRHVKAPLSNAKSTRNLRLALEQNGKFAIKTAVHMSLHSLAVTFNKEMNSLQLTEDQVTYWNQFLGTRQEHYTTKR